MKGMNRIAARTSKLGSVLSLTISLVMHLLVTLILSWLVVGYSGSGVPSFCLNIQQLDDANEEFASLELSSGAARQNNEESMQSMPEVPASSIQANSAIKLEPMPQNTNVSSSAFEESSVALMMGGGSGKKGAGGGSSHGKPSGYGASFFGARASGDRFVFVIDSSSSMIGPRWQALRRELIRAIESLLPEQEFFVISFDTLAHPMFNEIPPEGKFLKPTSQNIERLNRWVGSIQHGSSTFPASAIGIALRLEPDAIFLLSDGEIRDSTLYDLRIYNRMEGSDNESVPRIPIHTVLLDSQSGYLTLKSIAEENGGIFTPVRIFGY